jgi:ATP-dependent DNA helicase RecG
MKSQDKDMAMADFLANKTQILVATSVVEVGVDVPNASVMVIEGAERFGLSQLHQFRGRVGRAEHQSYCFLFLTREIPTVIEKLGSFCKTNDGFELAELDLKTRGFGELYGQTQSGWNFKYFNPNYLALIEPARQAAKTLLQEDSKLDRHLLLKEKTKDRIVHFE